MRNLTLVVFLLRFFFAQLCLCLLRLEHPAVFFMDFFGTVIVGGTALPTPLNVAVGTFGAIGVAPGVP